MREQLEKRLEQLRSELESGSKMLSDLQTKESDLRETLLRITGAIQVLEEELGQGDQQPGEGETPGDESSEGAAPEGEPTK